MCDYCEKDKTLIEEEIISSQSFGWCDKSTKICYDDTIKERHGVFIDRGYLRLVDFDDCNCMDHGEKIKIKFCPMCSKEQK